MKSSLATLFCAAALVGLSACASTSPAITAALAPAASIGTSVECDSGCKTEWQRAQLWLAKHSTMKVQTATDVLLQTYNTSEYTPEYSFTITKEPIGGERYQITAEAICGNPLGCSPKPLDVRNALLYYVKTGQDLLAGKSSGGAIR